MSEPNVIFENRDFVVIDKPAGLMVHPARVSARRRKHGKSGAGDEGNARAAEPTLTAWLVERYPEIKIVGDDPAMRPGIVHRLDKATSGVMVVARTQASFERLKRMFQERRIQKTYLAVVEGIPKKRNGTIDVPIGIKSGSLKRSVHSSKMAKPAVTDYSVVKAVAGDDGKEYAVLKVSPKTGRTHQIRVHLASIGHPIVGDPLYGRKRPKMKDAKPPAPIRLMLHAGMIAFSDGAGGRFEFDVPPPPDFLQ